MYGIITTSCSVTLLIDYFEVLLKITFNTLKYDVSLNHCHGICCTAVT